MGYIRLRVTTLLSKPPKGHEPFRGFREQGFTVYSKEFTPWKFDLRDFSLKMNAGEKIFISLYGIDIEIHYLVRGFATNYQELCANVKEEEIKLILEKAKLNKQRWVRRYVGERSRWP